MAHNQRRAKLESIVSPVLLMLNTFDLILDSTVEFEATVARCFLSMINEIIYQHTSSTNWNYSRNHMRKCETYLTNAASLGRLILSWVASTSASLRYFSTCVLLSWSLTTASCIISLLRFSNSSSFNLVPFLFLGNEAMLTRCWLPVAWFLYVVTLIRLRSFSLL